MPVTTKERGAIQSCEHHWVIATPNGRVSPGACKRCGQEREFRNSTDDRMWDSESFSLKGNRRPPR